MRHKLGRKAPTFTERHMKLAHSAGASLVGLGTPPAASADFVSAVAALVGNDWGMMGNDRLGDCTAADCGHSLMLRTANTGKWLKPSDDDIVALYSSITGYDPRLTDAQGNNPTDQGAEENAVCAYMRTTGLLGHKSLNTAPVATGVIDDAALDRIRWSIQLFGTCRLGVDLPNSAQDQFDANQPWVIAGDLTIDGGHDVPAVKYDPNYLYVVTWGRLQPVAWSWLKRFGEEAHMEIYLDFLMSTGLSPAGFDAEKLMVDMAELSV